MVNAPVNALYHQKILTEYVLALSPILTDIVTEGIAQKRFRVSFPRETVEILPGAGLVIFDEAYFRWTAKERLKRAATFIRAAELLLSTRPGNFAALAGIPETG